MKFCLAPNQITHILACLDVFVMLIIIIVPTSLILLLINTFLLDTHTVKSLLLFDLVSGVVFT